MLRTLTFWNPWWVDEKLPELQKRATFTQIPFSRKETLFITGVRRAGKTSLMYYLIQQLLKTTPKENILYINLDDEELKHESLQKIFDEYEKTFQTKGKTYVFLDEIQNKEEWHRWVKKYYDSTKDIKFIITGSKPALKKREATLLTGRMLTQEIYPLSFQEIIAIRNINTTGPYLEKNATVLQKTFEEYFEFGGFPEVVLEEDIRTKTLLLKEYYENIKDKDIITYFNIRDAKKFDELSYFFITNIAKPYSANKIGQATKLSTAQVEEYLTFAEETRFFFTLQHHNYSIKKQITKPRKLYAIDQGIVQKNSLSTNEDKGRILENIVFIELKRRGNTPYYHKEKHECDFITQKEAIQVCYKLTQDNEKREIQGLIEACKKHKHKTGTLITHDQEETRKQEGITIKIIPAWKWLLIQ